MLMEDRSCKRGAIAALIVLRRPHQPELSWLKHSADRNVHADVIAPMLVFSGIMKIRSSVIKAVHLCECILLVRLNESSLGI